MHALEQRYTIAENQPITQPFNFNYIALSELMTYLLLGASI
jgi:hypothetical protein